MNVEIKQLSECWDFFTTIGMRIFNQWWNHSGNTPDIIFDKLKEHDKYNKFPFTVVAFVDSAPVGSCCVIDNDCPLRPQYSPWVAAVLVDNAFRHKGIGSVILNEACRIAQGIGIEGLYIDCWAKTLPFYQRNGWEVLERDVGQKDSLVLYQRLNGKKDER